MQRLDLRDWDCSLQMFLVCLVLRLLVFVLLLCQLILPQLLLHFLLPCRVGPFGFIPAGPLNIPYDSHVILVWQIYTADTEPCRRTQE